MKKLYLSVIIFNLLLLIYGSAGAIFISKYSFDDTEYLKIIERFDRDSIVYFTFSDTMDTCIGLYGTKVLPFTIIDSIDTEKVDFLILIDGPGIIKYLDNKKLNNLIIEINNEKKPIGAFKISPALFMTSDIIKKRKLNMFLNDYIVKRFEYYKADYVNYDVLKVDNLISAYDNRFIDKFLNIFIGVLDENRSTEGQ